MDAKTFYKKLVVKMLKLARNSCLLRWFIKFLTDKLKVSKLFQNFSTVVRFGLAVMLFATGYHLLRRLFAQRRKQNYQRQEGSEQHKRQMGKK